MINNISTDKENLIIEKSIDESSMELLYRTLQDNIYSDPIGSIIREVVSNHNDAIKEKQIFIDIKNNPEKLSYYYQTSDDLQYKNSKFNPDYTTINNLSDNNEILIQIYEKDNKTYLSITDEGIGVDLNRLIGMSNLGYSTKRLSKEYKGFFGLGAKTAIAYKNTGYYTMDCICNNKRFVIDCYETDIKPAIPMFGENGINPFVEKDGLNIYYENTDSKNKTTFSLQIFKEDVEYFIKSIKLQLMYFNNVKLLVHGNEIAFKQNVIYEDEEFIITDSDNYYKNVQVVIVNEFLPKNHNAICYGTIDFPKLRMENLYGDIAIKCQIRSEIKKGRESILINDGVEITPSREAIIYNNITAKYIKERIESVKQKIIKTINKSRNLYKETDSIFKRLSLYGQTDKSRHLVQMAKFVNYRFDTTNLGKFEDSDLFYYDGMVTKFIPSNRNNLLNEDILVKITKHSVEKGDLKLKEVDLISIIKNKTNKIYYKDRNFIQEVSEHYVNDVYYLNCKEEYLKDIDFKYKNYSDLVNEYNNLEDEDKKPSPLIKTKKKPINRKEKFKFDIVESVLVESTGEKSDDKLNYYCYEKDLIDLDIVKEIYRAKRIPIARLSSTTNFKYFENTLLEYFTSEKILTELCYYNLEVLLKHYSNKIFDFSDIENNINNDNKKKVWKTIYNILKFIENNKFIPNNKQLLKDFKYIKYEETNSEKIKYNKEIIYYQYDKHGFNKIKESIDKKLKTFELYINMSKVLKNLFLYIKDNCQLLIYLSEVDNNLEVLSGNSEVFCILTNIINDKLNNYVAVK